MQWPRLGKKERHRLDIRDQCCPHDWRDGEGISVCHVTFSGCEHLLILGQSVDIPTDEFPWLQMLVLCFMYVLERELAFLPGCALHVYSVVGLLPQTALLCRLRGGWGFCSCVTSLAGLIP